jgi:prepilin-type N-terminal cleavage/methylation domain-containing protein
MKKRGFTLVELLAVIVILAIIALITTVVVINIIETVKIRKYKVEEKSLEKAAELYYTNSQIFLFQDEISLNTLVEKGFINSVKDTGNGSTCEGKVIKDNNGELKGCLKCSNYVTEGCGYVKDDEKDDGKKDDDEIKDENLGIICGSGTEEDYDNQKECHIKSVEDLVAFSTLVNSGKTFKEKTVYLDKDLNMILNGNFEPIGTSTNQFEGKFDGNAHTISNLRISKQNDNYVGLFGYVGGINSTNYATIVGLNVENTNVSGNSYVGGIAGYANSYTTINEVTVSGNIKGNGDYVGGIIGSSQSYTNLTGAIVNANVEGNNYVGGLAGGGKSTYSGIVESGEIKGTDNVYGSGRYISNAYINEKVIKNVPNTASTDWNGTVFPETSYNNLEDYSNLKVGSTPIIETQYSGDIDKSGYYFGYNNDTKENIVVIPAVN